MSEHSSAPYLPRKHDGIKIDRRLCRVFLPVKEWPMVDRQIWQRAKQANGLFDRAAPLAGLASDTVRGREQSLGRFLNFAVKSVGFDRLSSLIWIVSPELVNAYAIYLRSRTRDGSVFEELCRLQATFRILSPDHDFAWIRRLPAMPTVTEIQVSRKPINRLDPARVLCAALDTFDATRSAQPDIPSAQMARNALIIAFAVLFALRLKNLTEIKLGEHLVYNGGRWRLSFTETLKTESTILFDIPEFLQPRLQLYLDRYRQILLGNRPARSSLWLARGGKPISVIWTSKIIDRFGQQHLERSLNSHLFRHTFASMLVLREPGSVDLAAAALGHEGTNMVENVYTRSIGYEITGLWLKKLKKLQ